MKEDNPISHLFIYNKEINKFLIRELCYYLIILFLNDFESGLKKFRFARYKKLCDILPFEFFIYSYANSEKYK